MDLSVFFLVVCVAFYAYFVDRRRKQSAQEFSEHLAVLTARVYKLEEQTKQALSAVAVHTAATQTAPAHAPLPTPVAEKPAPVFPAPAATPPPPRPPIASPQPPSVSIPTAAKPQPSQTQPAPPPPPPPIPSAPRPSAGVSAPIGQSVGSTLPPPPPRTAPLPSVAQVQPRAAVATGASRAPQPVVKKPRRSFEEFVGVRLFSILGTVGIVVTVGYVLSYKWSSFPAWGRVTPTAPADLSCLAPPSELCSSAPSECSCRLPRAHPVIECLTRAMAGPGRLLQFSCCARSAVVCPGGFFEAHLPAA